MKRLWVILVFVLSASLAQADNQTDKKLAQLEKKIYFLEKQVDLLVNMISSNAAILSHQQNLIKGNTRLLKVFHSEDLAKLPN